MAVEVLGGPLAFDATIDLSQFDQQIAAMEENLQKVAKSAIDTAQKQQQAVEGIISSFTSGQSDIDNVIKKIQGLQSEYDKLTKQLSGTQDATLLKQYEDSLTQIQTLLDAAPAELYKAVLNEIEKQGVSTGEGVAGSLQQVNEKAISAFTQLRNIKAELAKTDPSSPAFDGLLEKGAELEKKIQGVNKELHLTSSNTTGLEALKQGVRGVIGVFESLSGVTGLLSDNNAAVEKSTRNVIAAMGVLNGIEEVGEVLSKESALNTYLLAQFRSAAAVATESQAVATGTLTTGLGLEATAATGATIATESLTVAMESNPAGILLLALTAIVVAVTAYTSSLKNAAEEQTAMNDAIAEANDLLVKLVALQSENFKNRTTDSQKAVALAEAQVKSESEITSLKIKALNAQRQENIFKLASLGLSEKDLAFKKIELESVLLQQKSIAELKTSTEDLSDFEQDRLKVLQAQQRALESQIDPVQKLMEDTKKLNEQQALLEAGRRKKAYDDSLKSAVAEADARLIIAKKNTSDELEARTQSIEAQRKLDLNNVNLTKGEIHKINAEANKQIEDARRDFRTLILSNERDLLQSKLNEVQAGSEDELKLRLQILEKAAEIELNQEGITQEQKRKIITEKIKEQKDAILRITEQKTEAEISVEVAGINTRLSKIQAGSAEELQLKKDLIDKQADIDSVRAGLQIKNEEFLAARILEIHAKSLADKKNLDDDYFDKLIKSQLKIIQDNTDKQNIPLESIVKNGEFEAKYKAQKQIFQNDLNGIEEKQKRIRTQINEGRGDIKKLNEQASGLEKKAKETLTGIDDLDDQFRRQAVKKLANDLNSLSSEFSSLAQSAFGFNDNLAETFNGLSRVAGAASSAISGFADLKKAADAFKQGKNSDGLSGLTSGIGAAVQLIGVMVTYIKEVRASEQQVQKDIMEFQSQIITGEYEINTILRQRQRDQVALNKLKIDGLNAEKKLLLEQQSINKSEFDDLIAKIQKESFVSGKKEKGPNIVLGILGGLLDIFGSSKTKVVDEFTSLAGKSFDELEKLFTEGRLTDKAKELFLQLQKIKDEGVDIDALLQQNAEVAKQAFTGTTADSITESIVEGFRNGMRSAEDFAGTFQDLMRKALLQSLKFQALEGPLKTFYDEFAKSAQSDNILTEEEINQLRDNFNGIITNAEDKFNELQKITDLSFTSGDGKNSLTGAIKGMTEQQADLLAGQFGGLRLTAIQQLNKVAEQLAVLNRIQINTAELMQIRKDIAELNDRGIKIRA